MTDTITTSYPKIEEIVGMLPRDAQAALIEATDGITDAETARRINATREQVTALRRYLGIYKNSISKITNVTDKWFYLWNDVSMDDLRVSLAGSRTWYNGKQGKRHSKSNTTTKTKSPKHKKPLPLPASAVMKQQETQQAPQQQQTENSLWMVLHGKYVGKQLASLLERLIDVFEEKETYEVDIVIETAGTVLKR